MTIYAPAEIVVVFFVAGLIQGHMMIDNPLIKGISGGSLFLMGSWEGQ